MTVFIFKTHVFAGRRLGRGDLIVLLIVTVLIYAGVRLAYNAPAVITGPEISLSPRVLPWYAALSVGRLTAAYTLSMAFTLVYGYIAAYNRRAEAILMPLLDVLQSVPILSFLPVVLLGLSAILPQSIAAELASVVLIFTSQAWNLTFAWYQSLTTIPKELREASAIFRFSKWLRLKVLEMPFAAISLVWNSMMSWAGGWFFLMAAEMFTVGHRDFRLPGLGSYLREAANQGDMRAISWGIGTLLLVIVLLDQLLWRPLLAWSDRFRLDTVARDEEMHSWFYEALRDAGIVIWLKQSVFDPVNERLDATLSRLFPISEGVETSASRRDWIRISLAVTGALILIYGAFRAGQVLLLVPLEQWRQILAGVLATLLRVSVALGIAMAWTVPFGYLIGTKRRLATWIQPMVQLAASVPATALFPIVLLTVMSLPGGLNIAAVILMLLGTQWYLLFTVIAGATAIPQDLRFTAALLRLKLPERWRTLILPALFPYLVTGAITASGGAWNASIVAEYVTFAGQTQSTVGIGALISHATAIGDYHLLLASTVSMILTVITLNRLVWRRLYVIAEERYRME